MPNFVFVRTKTVKGKQYAYLVENEWVRGRSKQRVVAYLGRVIRASPMPTPVIQPNTSSEEILSALIDQELAGVEEEFVFNRENNSFLYKNRPVVFALNGGFLCEHTLAQIMHAKTTTQEDRPGLALANAIANAGLRIPKHAFIKLYTSS